MDGQTKSCTLSLSLSLSPLSLSLSLSLVDDTLDSILTGSDDEEEQDQIIGQVLDEIGLEYTSKVLKPHPLSILLIKYLYFSWQGLE